MGFKETDEIPGSESYLPQPSPAVYYNPPKAEEEEQGKDRTPPTKQYPMYKEYVPPPMFPNNPMLNNLAMLMKYWPQRWANPMYRPNMYGAYSSMPRYDGYVTYNPFVQGVGYGMARQMQTHGPEWGSAESATGYLRNFPSWMRGLQFGEMNEYLNEIKAGIQPNFPLIPYGFGKSIPQRGWWQRPREFTL